MGLYVAQIASDEPQILTILAQHGYRVVLEREENRTRSYSCRGKCRRITFNISESPLRFSVGMGGSREKEITQILSDRGMFEKSSR